MLDHVTIDMPAGCEEIFGPVLPLIEVDSLQAAIDVVLARDKPLALYLFGDDAEADRVIGQTSAGMVGVNDTLMFHAVPELPFGGTGASGMGSYTGRSGFDTFSHLKPVLRRGTIFDLDVRYPPFTARKLGLLRRLR